MGFALWFRVKRHENIFLKHPLTHTPDCDYSAVANFGFFL